MCTPVCVYIYIYIYLGGVAAAVGGLHELVEARKGLGLAAASLFSYFLSSLTTKGNPSLLKDIHHYRRKSLTHGLVARGAAVRPHLGDSNKPMIVKVKLL